MGRKKPVLLGDSKEGGRMRRRERWGEMYQKEYVPVYSLSVVSLIPYGTRVPDTFLSASGSSLTRLEQVYRSRFRVAERQNRGYLE